MTSSYSYKSLKQQFVGQPMPFAFVDLDALDQNIQDIVARAGQKQIRVASKSVRSRPVLQHILAAHPQIKGVMCFTAPEAVWLSQQGFDDLLLGYPIWHPEQIQAICAEVRHNKIITLMIDSVAHIEHLQAIAHAEGVILRVCLDIDMAVDFPLLHFGVWRSGVAQVEQALAIYHAIEKSPNVILDGVMGYEAQIAGVGDDVPKNAAKNRVIRFLKQRSIQQIAHRRSTIIHALNAQGADLRFVNGGGTGSMETTRQEDVVTEITVGSGFYAPVLFDHYQGFQHQPAVGYAIEIVRQPQPHIYTCLGGGYIASGGIGSDKQPIVWEPTGAMLTDLEGAGEVQTPILYNGDESLVLGDPIFMRHSKAGELCERFNDLLVVRGGTIIDEFLTYRGEGQCFL